MKKNGFTLIELLAVIALLAILGVIAVPYMLNIYKENKKQSFIVEMRSIYKTATQKWLVDYSSSKRKITFSRCEGCTSEQLLLTGRDNIDYFIQLDENGKVIKIAVSDGYLQAIYPQESSNDDVRVSIEELNNAEFVDDEKNEEIVSILQFDSNSKECEPGYYRERTEGTCVACPKDTYKDVPGDQSCTPCGANSCSNGGATECYFCGGSIVPLNPGIDFP